MCLYVYARVRHFISSSLLSTTSNIKVETITSQIHIRIYYETSTSVVRRQTDLALTIITSKKVVCTLDL